jgi:hypothetical protein
VKLFTERDFRARGTRNTTKPILGIFLALLERLVSFCDIQRTPHFDTGHSDARLSQPSGKCSSLPMQFFCQTSSSSHPSKPHLDGFLALHPRCRYQSNFMIYYSSLMLFLHYSAKDMVHVRRDWGSKTPDLFTIRNGQLQPTAMDLLVIP